MARIFFTNHFTFIGQVFLRYFFHFYVLLGQKKKQSVLYYKQALTENDYSILREKYSVEQYYPYDSYY